ncbi:MAG: polysaccharide biosynthesis tyrosine autokinase [Pyrinomonadaceae bacterium]|nr:polysaccharide biosynthesis tyrosine autokinase [Sphingobacteriaceae bacterium]
MTSPQTEVYPVLENDSSSSFRETLDKYFYHWPLFLIGLLITLTCAFIYLKKAKPLYELKATLLIQDEKKTSEEEEALQEIDVTNSSKLAENEVEILKSRQLINLVVNDLQLGIGYNQKGRYTDEDLYGRSPVKLTLLRSSGDINGQELEIIIKNRDFFYLKGPNGDQKTFLYNKAYKSSFGTWKLTPTEVVNDFKDSEITITINDTESAATAIQKSLGATLLNKQAPAVSLTISDPVQQRGKDILNHLITHYNKASISEKNRITQSTLSFIDDRLDSLYKELNSAERDVEGFRSSRGLTDISSQSQVYLENVQTNDNRLNEVNVQLNVIQGIERYVNSSRNSNNVPSTLGIEDPALNSSIEQLAQLQLQREKMLATTPEGSPLFESLNRQVQTTKSSIRESIRNIKSSLQGTKGELQSFNSRFESSIKNIPGQERQYVGMKRQQGVKEGLYVYLLQKREEISLSYASTLADARIVDTAYLGFVKKPKEPLIYGMAFLLGLVLPASFMYGRDKIHNRITNRKEIEDVIGNPILGELSYERSTTPIVALDKSNFVIGEEFRALRTNLHFLHEKKQSGRVTLLTSSIAGEGKSFVSSNLALTLAASSRKTVLLELDLRKPKISEMFKLPHAHPGISNYLNGGSAIEDTIQPSGVNPNLDIIGSGPFPSNPSELLELPEVDILFAWLRANYDDIIVDTPPVNLVTDAMILARITDVTLYVIQQGYTYKSLLPFIKKLFTDQNFPKLKVVFNGIEKGKYGYGRNYGNNYYHSDDIKNRNSIFKNFSKRF